MTKLTDDDLRELDAKAAPGPWGVDEEFQGSEWGMVWSVHCANNILDCVSESISSEADARLIAAARDLPAEVLELRSALRGLIAFRNWELAEGGVTPPALQGVWKAAESALGVRT